MVVMMMMMMVVMIILLTAPYTCYDCNSGIPLPGYWRNTNCDESGYVADWYMPTPCDTFCYSSVGLYPVGGKYTCLCRGGWRRG